MNEQQISKLISKNEPIIATIKDRSYFMTNTDNVFIETDRIYEFQYAKLGGKKIEEYDTNYRLVNFINDDSEYLYVGTIVYNNIEEIIKFAKLCPNDTSRANLMKVKVGDFITSTNTYMLQRKEFIWQDRLYKEDIFISKDSTKYLNKIFKKYEYIKIYKNEEYLKFQNGNSIYIPYDTSFPDVEGFLEKGFNHITKSFTLSKKTFFKIYEKINIFKIYNIDTKFSDIGLLSDGSALWVKDDYRLYFENVINNIKEDTYSTILNKELFLIMPVLYKEDKDEQIKAGNLSLIVGLNINNIKFAFDHFKAEKLKFYVGLPNQFVTVKPL